MSIARRPKHRPGPGAKKLLGELELAIMRVAWSRPSVTVRDVLAVLIKKRPLAYNTVMTVMGRLTQKKLLTAEKSGRAKIYRAAQTQAEFEAQVAQQIVHALMADFGIEVALSQFINELVQFKPDQFAQLAKLILQAQAGQDRN